MKQPCRWFIEPGDPQTNEVIARELPGEEIQELAYDGETVRVLECPWRLVNFFSQAPGLSFSLYARNGNGPVRKADCVIRGKKVAGGRKCPVRLIKASDLRKPKS